MMSRGGRSHVAGGGVGWVVAAGVVAIELGLGLTGINPPPLVPIYGFDPPLCSKPCASASSSIVALTQNPVNPRFQGFCRKLLQP